MFPMCCDACIHERKLPSGYGPYPDMLNGFPTSPVNQSGAWWVSGGDPIIPGSSLNSASWSSGEISISGFRVNCGASFGTVFRIPDRNNQNGLDFPNHAGTVDTKLHTLVAESIAIQSATSATLEFTITADEVTGNADANHPEVNVVRYSGSPIVGVVASVFGFQPLWDSTLGWRWRWDGTEIPGANTNSLDVVMVYEIDYLQVGSIRIHENPSVNRKIYVGGNLIATDGSSRPGWNVDWFHFSLATDLNYPNNAPGGPYYPTIDAAISVSNLSFKIQDGEAVHTPSINFTAKRPQWTGGTQPTWDTTGLTEAELSANCNDVDRVTTGMRMGAESPSIAVTPNKLYRLELDCDDTNDAFPMVVVNDRSVSVLPKLDTGVYGSWAFGTDNRRPNHHPKKTGYYYRAESEKLKIGLIGDPDTIGHILSAELKEVLSDFRVDYPFRVNTSAGSTNWKFPAGQQTTIAPTITGGIGPFVFEAFADHGIPFFGSLNPSTGEIVLNPTATGSSGDTRIVVTDANGKKAVSLLFRWKV